VASTSNSHPELSGIPRDFWDTAVLVEPVRKQAISLRVDEDVLTWFKECGPRYQSRMNAVAAAPGLRSSRAAWPSRRAAALNCWLDVMRLMAFLRPAKPAMADHSVRFDAIPTDSLVARAPGLANPKNVINALVATRHCIVGIFDNTIPMLASLTT